MMCVHLVANSWTLLTTTTSIVYCNRSLTLQIFHKLLQQSRLSLLLEESAKIAEDKCPLITYKCIATHFTCWWLCYILPTMVQLTSKFILVYAIHVMCSLILFEWSFKVRMLVKLDYLCCTQVRVECHTRVTFHAFCMWVGLRIFCT